MQPIPGSAEFPNDNPLLHHGAVWLCTKVRGSPRAILRALPEPVSAPEPEPVSLSAPEPLPPRLVELVAPPDSAPIATTSDPEPDPFAEYVQVVVEVVLEAGATRAAAKIPDLLSGQLFEAGDFDVATAELLVARGFAERSHDTVVPSAQFQATVSTWRRVLRGEPADLADCGAAMLDQWTAEFVAALLGASTARFDDLRRQLRRKGVAAFGMLARAA